MTAYSLSFPHILSILHFLDALDKFLYGKVKLRVAGAHFRDFVGGVYDGRVVFLVEGQRDRFKGVFRQRAAEIHAHLTRHDKVARALLRKDFRQRNIEIGARHLLD